MIKFCRILGKTLIWMGGIFNILVVSILVHDEGLAAARKYVFSFEGISDMVGILVPGVFFFVLAHKLDSSGNWPQFPFFPGLFVNTRDKVYRTPRQRRRDRRNENH